MIKALSDQVQGYPQRMRLWRRPETLKMWWSHDYLKNLALDIAIYNGWYVDLAKKVNKETDNINIVQSALNTIVSVEVNISIYCYSAD